MNSYTDEFLSHYGVKGMRWGIRKKEDRAEAKLDKRHAKAKKFDAKAKSLQDKIDALDENSETSSYKKRIIKMEKEELNKEKAVNVKAAKDIRDGKLTDRQKKAIKGAAIVGGIVAVGVTYSMLQSGEGRRLMTKGAMFVRGQDTLFPFKMKPKLMADMDVDGIMKDIVPQINPDYGGIGTKMNCRRCTMAYELRRRGYDVMATRTTNAHGQTLLGMETVLDPKAPAPITSGKIATGLKLKKRVEANPEYLMEMMESGKLWGNNPISDANTEAGIFKALRLQPNGSRGELGVKWAFGGGHSMAYEIVNGKVVIFDTQSGKAYKNVAELKRAFKDIGGISEAGFTRLDDIPLNSDFLLRWVKNA